MIEVVSSQSKKNEKPLIKSCRIYGQTASIEERLKKYSHIKPSVISPLKMKNVSRQCEEYFFNKMKLFITSDDTKTEKSNVTVERNSTDTTDDGESEDDEESNLLKGVVIFPGTKWCGAGDIAENYDDLGSDKDTDSCCREHDHCDDNIGAGKSKHGLNNTDSYTKSACECDDKFYRCLQEAKSFLGDQVGRTYFNLLQTQCFKEDHPIVACDDVKGFVFNKVRKACQSYQLDTSQPKEYQFFDAKFYVGQHGPLFNIPVISSNLDPIVKNVKNVTINGGIIGSIIG